MRGQAASFITVAQVALAQGGAERTSVPGVCLCTSADDSFVLSDGSSIALKGHDNLLVEVKSTNIAIKPVKLDEMIWKTTQGEIPTSNFLLELKTIPE